MGFFSFVSSFLLFFSIGFFLPKEEVEVDIGIRAAVIPVVIFSNIGLSLVMSGYVYLCLVMSGYIWLRLVASGYV